MKFLLISYRFVIFVVVDDDDVADSVLVDDYDGIPYWSSIATATVFAAFAIFLPSLAPL